MNEPKAPDVEDILRRAQSLDREIAERFAAHGSGWARLDETLKGVTDAIRALVSGTAPEGAGFWVANTATYLEEGGSDVLNTASYTIGQLEYLARELRDPQDSDLPRNCKPGSDKIADDAAHLFRDAVRVAEALRSQRD